MCLIARGYKFVIQSSSVVVGCTTRFLIYNRPFKTVMATGGRDDFRNINGTVVPNRIFVGGISGNTNEDDLWNLFSKFGNVKATKIILDKAGISRGYGFVTFETEEEALKVLNDTERQILKERKLNIAPAVKKQPYGRALETSSVHSAPIVWPTQPYSGTPAGFSRDSVYYPQTTWPFMWPQQFYLQQQCQYPQATVQSGYPQYVYSIAPPSDYPYQTATAVTNSDYSETSSADSGESNKSRSKQPVSTPATDYDRGRQVQPKVSSASQSSSSSVTRFSNGSAETPPSYMHSAPVHHMHHPVFAKTVNGVTVMAYPRSFVMGSPVIHVKDCASESDNVFSELGYLQSNLAPGALTPPPTPLASIPCDFNSNVESIREY